MATGVSRKRDQSAPPDKRRHLTDRGLCRKGLRGAEFERRAGLMQTGRVVVVDSSTFVGRW